MLDDGCLIYAIIECGQGLSTHAQQSINLESAFKNDGKSIIYEVFHIMLHWWVEEVINLVYTIKVSVITVGILRR